MKDHKEIIQATLSESGPLAAFSRNIAENQTLSKSDRLDIGRRVVSERSAIYTSLAGRWALARHERLGYTGAFVVLALGGRNIASAISAACGRAGGR